MNGGNAASSSARALREPGAPIFDWSRRRLRSRLRLAAFLVLSVAAHAFFFYLFKVVYEPSERLLPRPSRVLLLHRGDPRAATMLRDLDDRFAASGGSVSSAVSGDLRLEELSAIYEASYAGHELALRVPGFPGPAVGLPPARDPGQPEFPPVAAGRERSSSSSSPSPDPGVASGPPGPASVVVVAGGSLADRKPTRVPEVDPASWSGSGSGRAVFMIGVDRSGRVVHRFPSDRDGLPDVTAIGAFVGGLAFEPDEGAEAVEWGSVELRW